MSANSSVNSGTPPDLSNPDFVASLGDPDPTIVQILQPDNLRPRKTLAGSIRALHMLPFVEAFDIEHSLDFPPDDIELNFIKDACFPITRIIGAVSFQSWSGRGYHEGKLLSKNGRPSAKVIHDYSHRQPDWEGDDPDLGLFRDGDGEVWAYVETGGAHRTAATKLRGDRGLRCTVATRDYSNLPYLDASVSDSLLAWSRHERSLPVNARALKSASMARFIIRNVLADKRAQRRNRRF